MKIGGHKTRSVFDRSNTVNQAGLKNACELVSKANEDMKETVERGRSSLAWVTDSYCLFKHTSWYFDGPPESLLSLQWLLLDSGITYRVINECVVF